MHKSTCIAPLLWRRRLDAQCLRYLILVPDEIYPTSDYGVLGLCAGNRMAFRARQGAMMGAPDYAHWHGFFELQQDLYKLEQIHAQRVESGEIE